MGSNDDPDVTFVDEPGLMKEKYFFFSLLTCLFVSLSVSRTCVCSCVLCFVRARVTFVRSFTVHSLLRLVSTSGRHPSTPTIISAALKVFYIHSSIHPSIHPFTPPSVHPFTPLSVHPPIHMPTNQFIHSSIHSSILPSTHPFTPPSVHPPIHPPTNLGIHPSSPHPPRYSSIRIKSSISRTNFRRILPIRHLQSLLLP